MKSININVKNEVTEQELKVNWFNRNQFYFIVGLLVFLIIMLIGLIM